MNFLILQSQPQSKGDFYFIFFVCVELTSGDFGGLITIRILAWHMLAHVIQELFHAIVDRLEG